MIRPVAKLQNLFFSANEVVFKSTKVTFTSGILAFTYASVNATRVFRMKKGNANYMQT